MSAQHRRYLILLDPRHFGGGAAPAAARVKFFDWLDTTDGEVVEDGGANRLVVFSSYEVAERIKDLEYVVKIEPYG
ncbi:hypothetical protein AB4305_21215 [Nocardia sp. 2YAB30]|uniref:hypothetical protein n=1 Tax=unclassified Nocardia TaxID=2637762 RepID=UPI003F9DE4DE